MRIMRMVTVVLIVLLNSPGVACASSSEVTVDQAASQVTSARGQKRVVLIFKSGCSRCQAFLPAFDEFVKDRLDRRARVLVFSVDRDKDALDRYLGKNRFSFRSAWMRPWKQGDLSKAMTPAGVRIGASFRLPLVAVLDKDGKSLGQWEGMSPGQIARIEAALK